MARDALSTVACRECGTVDAPRVSWQQNERGPAHLRAECQYCGRWVKWLPQTDEWLQLAPAPPEGGWQSSRAIDEETKWTVWERDDFRCRTCGARRFLTIDHIVPFSKGGLSVPENFQTLCRSCNSRKGNRE